MKYIILILTTILAITSCELIPNLERDNANDVNFTGDKNKLPIEFEIKEIGYVFSYVTNGGTGFSQGSKTYVKINLQNKTISDLENVSAVVSTSSSSVSLSTTNFPIYFKNSYGIFASNEERQGKLYSQNNDIIEAPNGLPYSFYIEISSAASKGDIISFKIEVTEKQGRQWQDTFEITIE